MRFSEFKVLIEADLTPNPGSFVGKGEWLGYAWDKDTKVVNFPDGTSTKANSAADAQKLINKHQKRLKLKTSVTDRINAGNTEGNKNFRFNSTPTKVGEYSWSVKDADGAWKQKTGSFDDLENAYKKIDPDGYKEAVKKSKEAVKSDPKYKRILGSVYVLSLAYVGVNIYMDWRDFVDTTEKLEHMYERTGADQKTRQAGLDNAAQAYWTQLWRLGAGSAAEAIIGVAFLKNTSLTRRAANAALKGAKTARFLPKFTPWTIAAWAAAEIGILGIEMYLDATSAAEDLIAGMQKEAALDIERATGSKINLPSNIANAEVPDPNNVKAEIKDFWEKSREIKPNYNN